MCVCEREVEIYLTKTSLHPASFPMQYPHMQWAEWSDRGVILDFEGKGEAGPGY